MNEFSLPYECLPKCSPRAHKTYSILLSSSDVQTPHKAEILRNSILPGSKPGPSPRLDAPISAFTAASVNFARGTGCHKSVPGDPRRQARPRQRITWGFLERQNKNQPPVFQPFLQDLITDVLTFLLHRVSLKDLPRRNIWKPCFRYNPVWESLLLALSLDDRELNYKERACTLHSEN